MREWLCDFERRIPMQHLHPCVVLTTCDLSAVGKHLLHFLSLVEGYYRARKRAALLTSGVLFSYAQSALL